MSYNYSKLSLKRLSECHPDLQKIANELIKEMDVTVLCGFRNQADQNAAYERGNSKLRWPKSKHNKQPALAVDIVPYPIQWNNLEPYREMRGRVQKIANRLKIKVRFISWDWPHIELA